MGMAGAKLEDIMQENSSYPRGALKRRLLREGILKNECSICGMEGMWQGKPIVHILDHINGVNNDHRPGNLRIVCRNCDSQLPTFTGRNAKRIKKVWSCGTCSVAVSKGRYRCRSCAQKELMVCKIKWPPVPELQEEVKATSYSAVGRRLGVSDNAVRKRIQTRSNK